MNCPHCNKVIGSCEERSYADLIERLYRCRRMVGDMCAEGRPPKMSIPARVDVDEDIVICRTISEAIVALGGTVETPMPSTEERMKVTDEMVNRFLSWKLPPDFGPDCGISFKPITSHNLWPVGTNLLTAQQARAMLEHVLQEPALQEHYGSDAPKRLPSEGPGA